MSSVSSAAGRRPATSDHRWLILVIVAIAQLMVVLDATVVNIALPSAQHALGFPNSDRQWVVTAYALAFGSLLLLGGRLGDMFSRKRVFITGLVGFALSSALGGAAVSFEMLVTARALQGVFGAILAPSALGTLVSTFRNPRERGRAFGVFGSVAGGGGAVGLILGGVLTQYFSWRWTLYVNLVFAAIAVTGALLYMRTDAPANRPKMDWLGAVLASAGLFAIVFGLSMDYEVFLVSRMHERWVRTGDDQRAVQEGLALTGRSDYVLARWAPMRNTATTAGSVPRLPQRWRVPFCTTVSPARSTFSAPSSSSRITSPDRTTSKSIVSVVCIPGLSGSR